MTDFMTRLAELAGAEIATALVAEFGGQTVYIHAPHDFVELAIEAAFRAEMTRLMAAAVTAHPGHHHELLATAQQLPSQRLAALALHASLKTTLVPPAQPASAA